MKNTEIACFTYRYRDANNFKIESDVLLKGKVTFEINAAFRACLLEGEWFVPEQVGLPALQPGLFSYSNGPTNADHALHEFVSLRAEEEVAGSNFRTNRSLAALLKEFQLASQQWDLSLSPLA